MKTETPLLRFLRALPTAADRELFAKACETTKIYLYQIAADSAPNPRLRLALAIVEQSAEFLRYMPLGTRIPSLSLQDLLIGAEEVEDETTAEARLKAAATIARVPKVSKPAPKVATTKKR